MLKRTNTHRIDTKAIRTIFAHLHENWLVRSLDERDYGIDLQLERFDMDDATGDFIFVQVKGTDNPFKKTVKLSGFPVDTINYALMFDVPFFLFHTSNTSKQTKFVWLQKYVEVRLAKDNPRWKDQKSVTICFPKENNLENNDKKLTEIIKKDKQRKVGVKFLASYESLKFHSSSVLDDDQTDVAEICEVEAKKLWELSSFINHYRDSPQDDNYIDFNTLASAYQQIFSTKKINPANRKTVDSAMEFLERIKDSFLNEESFDDFAADNNSDSPY